MDSKLLIMSVSAFLLSLAACDSDESFKKADKIPAVVLRDFNQRHGGAIISSYHPFSDNTQEINFTDREKNKASTYYENDEWVSSITQINDTSLLPKIVRKKFEETYPNAPIEEIKRIERREISYTLYYFSFTYPKKNSLNLTHVVLMNEDGYMFPVFHYPLNEYWFQVSLREKQLDFIKKRYPDADIRSYFNSGEDTYFVIQNDTLKKISFRNNSDKWKETRYELSPTTVLPQKVIDKLRKIHPGFHYTQIIYVESPQGNCYLLSDMDADDELGYFISE